MSIDYHIPLTMFKHFRCAPWSANLSLAIQNGDESCLGITAIHDSLLSKTVLLDDRQSEKVYAVFEGRYGIMSKKPSRSCQGNSHNDCTHY